MSMSEWLAGKTIGELEALELDGRTHFHDSLKRRDKDGNVIDVPVLVRVPRKPERAQARMDAVVWARELKIDRDKDADIFDDLDTICLVARSLREPSRPGEQFRDARTLAETYETRAIWDILDRLTMYENLIDPRVVEWDEQTFWTAVHGIARVRNLSPLTGIAGRGLDSFVQRMACLLSSYQTGKLSAPSIET